MSEDIIIPGAREMQVLHGVAEGKTNAEIARDLFLGEETVKTYVRRVLIKLGAENRAHAVAIAMRASLID